MNKNKKVGIRYYPLYMDWHIMLTNIFFIFHLFFFFFLPTPVNWNKQNETKAPPFVESDTKTTEMLFLFFSIEGKKKKICETAINNKKWNYSTILVVATQTPAHTHTHSLLFSLCISLLNKKNLQNFLLFRRA